MDKKLNFNWKASLRRNKEFIVRYHDSSDLRAQYIKHVSILNKIFTHIDSNKTLANKYVVSLLELISVHTARLDTGTLINARMFKNGPTNNFLRFEILDLNESETDTGISTTSYHDLLVGCTAHYGELLEGKVSEAHCELDLHLRDLITFINSKNLILEGDDDKAEVDATLPYVPEDYKPEDNNEWYTVHAEEKNNAIKITIVHKQRVVMQTVTNPAYFPQDYFSLMLQLNTSISSGARESFFLSFSTPMKKFIAENKLKLNKLENNQFHLIDNLDITLKVTDPSVYFVLINDSIKDVSQIFNI
jgi:hypothetical protein